MTQLCRQQCLDKTPDPAEIRRAERTAELAEGWLVTLSKTT